MKNVLIIFFLVLLISFGCEKPDDIVSLLTTAVTVTDITQTTATSSEIITDKSQSSELSSKINLRLIFSNDINNQLVGIYSVITNIMSDSTYNSNNKIMLTKMEIIDSAINKNKPFILFSSTNVEQLTGNEHSNGILSLNESANSGVQSCYLGTHVSYLNKNEIDTIKTDTGDYIYTTHYVYNLTFKWYFTYEGIADSTHQKISVDCMGSKNNNDDWNWTILSL